jgi:hypothetical protein
MTTQPGWYDDPENANGQRYWDGQAWTPHRQRKPDSQPPAAPSLPPPQAAPAPGAAYPPPAPQAGWQPPAYPPAGPPPQRSTNTGLIIGIVVGVIALLAGGAGILAWQQHWFDKPKSPEDQIRLVVQREMDDFNASKFSHDPAIQCKANAVSDDKNAKDGPDVLAQAGNISASVANIHVTGDSATADATVTFSKAPGKSKTLRLQFVKEDGGWKECTPDSANDDEQNDGDSGN